MLFKSISGSAYTKSKTSVIRYVQLIILIMLILSGMLFSSCSSVSKLVSGSNDDTTSDTKKEKFIPFPEKWLEHRPGGSKAALNQAVQELFQYVETDREKFESCFAKRLRNEDTFKGFVDEFLRAFPKGLSQCTIPELSGHPDKIAKGDQLRLNTTESFRVTLNNETYFISVLICYHDKTNPENVGVNEFRIMNQSGWSRYYADMLDVIQNSSGKIKQNSYTVEGRTYNYLQCFYSDEPTRMINGFPQLWKETDYQVMTADEMSAAMKECETIIDLAKKIGQPNSNTNAGRSYYEIKSDNNAPLYVEIVSDETYGTIYWAYKCDAETINYDDPVYKKQ